MISARKIAIIGGSGTGKTTLTNNLERKLNIHPIHIDSINYFENWEQRDKVERDKIIVEKLSEKEWIIDGTYISTLKERLQLADLIIYLDYSAFSQVIGVLKRYFKNPGVEKPDIPGCKEKMSFNFLWWVITWRKNKRQRVLNIINNVDKNKVLIFKNRKSLNKWYYEEFKEKIKIDF